jgi:hypothetical protein
MRCKGRESLRICCTIRSDSPMYCQKWRLFLQQIQEAMKTYTRILLAAFSFLLTFTALAQQKVEQWGRFELAMKHEARGNAYLTVDLRAVFSHADTSFTVSGFYDGDNTFRVRFMPCLTGAWTYKTLSNVPALNNQKGSFECLNPSAENHGMVKVANMYDFKYADGKYFYPFGTTAYAWVHMGKALQEQTLASLQKSGFNKVRMCVFPKNYNLVKEEPELYPFMIKEVTKDANGKETKIWDFERFNPAFFQHLEQRIDDLNKLGIEADLILFHPYDKGRWGFDAMPNEVNVRYIKYVAARLSSYKNVWWSLANEWDLVKEKTKADWDLFATTVVKADPYRHLCSIHGATATYYEYWKPEFTHVSIQDEAPVQSSAGTAMLRNVYHKPVICDEVGYEGNLASRWGRYSGEEMTHLVWNGVIGGGYVTHGDCFMNKDDKDTIFWAKGGEFKGQSWKRIAFLRQIMEAGPGPLRMADISRDYLTATAASGYFLVYFGKLVQPFWLFNLPAKAASFGRLKPGAKYRVDIIDTWDMSIQACPLVFETAAENDYRLYDKDLKKVWLPLKPYMALRITEVK